MSEQEMTDESLRELITRPLMRNEPPFLWDVLWDGTVWVKGFESKELAEAWLEGAENGWDCAQIDQRDL